MDPKTTFNSAADLYAEIRPGYPPELVDDIVGLSELTPQSSILEVGCGTGKATTPFAEIGCTMVCLDIGPDLLAVARQSHARFPDVSFVQSSFEDWVPDRQFDLVISATAIGWVDPEVRFVKAREVLGPEGALAFFSNTHVHQSSGFFAEVQEIYDLHYRPPASRVLRRHTRASDELPGVEAFSEPIRRLYPWSTSYTTAEYINLLSTYSDHISLPDRNRSHLFEGIAHLIESRYGGSVLKHYEAMLDFRSVAARQA